MEERMSFKPWFFFAAALVVLGLEGYRVWNHRPSDRLQQIQMKAPDFVFPERGGQVFSSDQLKGKVWAVDFIFAHCAGSCPLLSQQMALLQREWKGNPDFRLVTFTVDPERDTVEALKKYADDLKADPVQWSFLTGKKDDIYKVIRDGFKAAAQRDPLAPVGFEFIHSSRIYLVDAKGMVRGFYDGTDETDLKKLHQDIKFLMNKWSKS